MEKISVLVIGAGASGLMAGITAARNGAAVTIVEHNPKAGKKLLATGNGKCNLTNLEQSSENYRGEDSSFAQFALTEFSVQDTIQFFSSLGIFTKNKAGYIYPVTEQASSVLDVLLMEAEQLNIKIKYQEHVIDVKKVDNLFRISTSTYTYHADRVILSCGSKASALQGADGSGYELAVQLGHTLIEPRPALVQLLCKEKLLNKLAGIRVQASVSLYIDGQLAAMDQGELQLTRNGISGIPVFQVSRYAAKAIAEGRLVEASINYLPDFRAEGLVSYLKMRIKNTPYKSVSKMLIGLFNDKLIPVLLECASIEKGRPCSELTEGELQRIQETVQAFRVTIIADNGFEQAQVCSGGVNTEEVDGSTLQSQKVQGLYFSGELLDIDGICGGYNLQWAWSSGYTAGRYAAKQQERNE